MRRTRRKKKPLPYVDRSQLPVIRKPLRIKNMFTANSPEDNCPRVREKSGSPLASPPIPKDIGNEWETITSSASIKRMKLRLLLLFSATI